MIADARLSKSDVWLLAMVTLSWGLSFPIIKYAVTSYPPLAFRTICLVIGVVFLGFYLLRQNESLQVPRSQWWSLLKIVFVTMTLWQIGLIYGVKLLNGGRAAIIGYTFPVWALIGSIVFYKAPFTWRSVLGVAFALGATALLALSDLDRFLERPVGILVMLSAAMAWGFGTAITRHTPVTISNPVLAQWSMIITLIVFVPLTIVFEHAAWRVPTFGETLAMLYSGIVTFVFCYVVWFKLSRKLPAAVSGLSIMLVPVIGVISSALFFSEHVTGADLVALVMIVLSMIIVLRAQKTPVPSTDGVVVKDEQVLRNSNR